jgi:hypothetical protein
MFVIWEVVFERFFLVQIFTIYTAALMAKYLNVRLRMLGTIMIQIVRVLQHDSADTGS